LTISDYNQLIALDKKHIWHPFTQMLEWQGSDPLIITEGKGCYIKDILGRWYLDGVSSLWVNIHGHRRQEINQAIIGQLDKIAHSTLLGLSGHTSILLAERICNLLNSTLCPDNPSLNKVFFSDNGSTAVEVGLKMAFQYWRNIGQTDRITFISLNNAYHGDTIGAVSVGGVDIFHSTFGALLFKTFKTPSPYCYRCELGLEISNCNMACLDKMEEILKIHSQTIAGVIIEPLIQAAGGMILAPCGFLNGVRRLCTKYNTLMIADEVATGFGRTGTMFACESESVVPDIICLSKGITGGYLPLAVTVARDFIYDAFLGETKDFIKTFFHGHSYTGNPLACAAALACLDIFETDNTLVELIPKIVIFDSWLDKISTLPHVGNTRHAGLMAGIELVINKDTKEPYPYEQKMGYQVTDNLRKRGVILRPLGNVIVIMPPLSISIEELSTMLEMIEASIIEVTGT
jgi:adenosylmethionine-8-amino-7-oxononanoate aminotransferase